MTDDVDAPGARPASGGDVVRALASGLAVLRAFTPDTPTLSVSEAAARTVMVLLELAVAEELPAAFEPDEFVLLDPPQPDRPSTAADAVAAVAVVRERFILVAFCLSVG